MEKNIMHHKEFLWTAFVVKLAIVATCIYLALTYTPHCLDIADKYIDKTNESEEIKEV